MISTVGQTLGGHPIKHHEKEIIIGGVDVYVIYNRQICRQPGMNRLKFFVSIVLLEHSTGALSPF